jgi:hypothetical protein
MARRAWPDKAANAGVALVAVDVCLFVFKWLLFKRLFGKHDDLLVGASEIGLIMSIAAFVLTVFDMRKIWRVILAIGSLVLGYLWYSSLLWWVMAK